MGVFIIGHLVANFNWRHFREEIFIGDVLCYCKCEIKGCLSAKGLQLVASFAV